MPPELTTALLAMLPVTELRLALPAGVGLGLSGLAAFFWATAGNILVAIALIYLLEPIVNFLRTRVHWIDHLAAKIFAKTRSKHSANFDRFGALFLVLLVAVPLPGSGGYTGTLVAYLFGVPKKSAVFLISLGLILSGLIVLGLTTGWLAFAESL
jgi:uncharacterized membrane protein